MKGKVENITISCSMESTDIRDVHMDVCVASTLALRTQKNRPLNEDNIRGIRKDDAEIRGSGKWVIA